MFLRLSCLLYSLFYTLSGVWKLDRCFNLKVTSRQTKHKHVVTVRTENREIYDRYLEFLLKCQKIVHTVDRTSLWCWYLLCFGGKQVVPMCIAAYRGTERVYDGHSKG
jgi:hypothetical protein